MKWDHGGPYLSRTMVRARRRRVFPEKAPQKEIITFDEVDW
jgi:hypothetical protein